MEIEMRVFNQNFEKNTKKIFVPNFERKMVWLFYMRQVATF